MGEVNKRDEFWDLLHSRPEFLWIRKAKVSFPEALKLVALHIFKNEEDPNYDMDLGDVDMVRKLLIELDESGFIT